MIISNAPNWVISLSECRLTGGRHTWSGSGFSQGPVSSQWLFGHVYEYRAERREVYLWPGLALNSARLCGEACQCRGIEIAICSSLTHSPLGTMRGCHLWGPRWLTQQSGSREPTRDTDEMDPGPTSTILWLTTSHASPCAAVNINQVSAKLDIRPKSEFCSGETLGKLLNQCPLNFLL